MSDPNETHRRIPGFDALWTATSGSPDICIAVLDGPVDLAHPCFAGARLTALPTLASEAGGKGGAAAHGTHVASVIFGQAGSQVSGVAPSCRGLIIPIFSDGADGALIPCSQVDLARAITQAVEHGAHVINVSGGQLSESGQPDTLLLNAIVLCEQRNVLLVAAAGNDGCDCLHIPASAASTLVVGALDQDGRPMHVSNWGEAYRARGLMAPGARILGALPGGATGYKSGTSFATPIVSAVVALLLCRQLQHGDRADPRGVCAALLHSATRCNTNGDVDCRRLLTGTLNVLGATQLILKGKTEMSDQLMIEASEAPASTVVEANLDQPGIVAAQYVPAAAPAGTAMLPASSGINASDCGCAGAAKGPTLVYALGILGTDFGSEARRDSFVQAMPSGRNNPDDPQQLLEFLRAKPYYVQSLIWTVNLDATTIYAVMPGGAYAHLAYDFLVNALAGTIDGSVAMNSFPGFIAGSVKLMSGQVVPAIEPAVRGLFSWNTPELLNCLAALPTDPKAREQSQAGAREGLENFLNRIYYDFRNLGIAGGDRALNYSATNVIQALEVLTKTVGMQLDTIVVTPSPVCRPGSECYDIVLSFFTPSNMNIANSVSRFAIDVSDVIPVSVGPVRSWSQR